MCGIDPDALGDNLVRARLFMAAARFTSQQDCDGMFEAKYFDGIVIPRWASGVGLIRKLRWTGGEETPLFLYMLFLIGYPRRPCD